MFSTTLYAAETAAKAPAAPSFMEQLPFVLMIFAAVYFIMIRPQAKSKRAKRYAVSS